jgi:ribonucleoside-diphosphate reductase alpha chain
MLRVIRNHAAPPTGSPPSTRRDPPRAVAIDHALCPDRPLSSARTAWDARSPLGEAHGYRNAQATVIAPTGTIGLVMDCDTTGIEPDFALVKFKKLAGGGYFKIINQSVPRPARLGYDDARSPRSSSTRRPRHEPRGRPASTARRSSPRASRRRDRRARGDLARPSTSSSCSTCGRSARRRSRRLGFTEDQLADPPTFDLLPRSASRSQIEAANVHVCGA